MHVLLFRGVSLGLAISFVSAIPAAEIIPIGSLGLGVSGDGKIVVGAAEGDMTLLASRWTAEDGLQGLAQGAAYDISHDGTVIVGERPVGGGSFRWDSVQGFLDLGVLSRGGSSNARDVSGDGGVVVGLATESTGLRGFRWTQSTGMIPLGDLPGGFDFSQASSISGDGQTTVGVSTGADGDRAVRWDGANPVPVDLGLPQGLTGFTEARGIRVDGQVIVGVWGNGLMNEAFRWTSLGGFQLLDDLPGGLVDSVGYATNLDGSVIVGTGNIGEDVPDEAFYWTQARGMRSLRDVLVEAGADVSAWQTPDMATSLSDDGRVIVGTGTLVDGSVAGFRAVLQVPEPTSLMLLMAAAMLGIPLRR